MKTKYRYMAEIGEGGEGAGSGEGTGSGEGVAGAAAAAQAASAAATGDSNVATAVAGDTNVAAAATSTNLPEWIRGLPVELQADETLGKFGTPADLAKSYKELEGFRGRSIALPTEDNNPQQRQEFIERLIEKVPELVLKPDPENQDQSDEFYSMLGRPKTPDEYTIPKVDGAEGLYTDEELAGYKQVMHQAGLTDQQFQTFTQLTMQGAIEAQAEHKQGIAQQMADLSKEWGHAFEGRIAKAFTFAQTMKAPQQVLDLMLKGELDAGSLKWIHGMAEQFGGEGVNLGGDVGDGNQGLSPEEARSQMDLMLKNKEHPLNQPTHANHAAAKKKLVELQRAASSL